MDNQTKTKIKNVLLAIVGGIAALVFASEIENPEYWWIYAVAAVILFIIIKVAIGGKDDRDSQWRGKG